MYILILLIAFSNNQTYLMCNLSSLKLLKNTIKYLKIFKKKIQKIINAPPPSNKPPP